MGVRDHFPKRDRLGASPLSSKCASHPRTMFFNGLARSPLNKRLRLPGARQHSDGGVSGSTDGTAAPCTSVFWDVSLHPQRPVLASEPPEFLSLLGRERARPPTAGIDLRLPYPAAQRRLGEIEFPRHRRVSHQADQLRSAVRPRGPCGGAQAAAERQRCLRLSSYACRYFVRPPPATVRNIGDPAEPSTR